MLSQGYALPSCHWPWTFCAASQERPIDLYRYVGARRTHCSTSGEKRHGRGGNVSKGYVANMHGHYVMQCSTCVITTQWWTYAGAAPNAVQEHFKSVALLYAPLLLACALDCRFETHNLQQDGGHKGTVRETAWSRHHCATHVYCYCSCVKTQWCI